MYTHGYYNFLFPGLASNVTEDIFRYYIFMSIILKSYSVVLSAAAAKSLQSYPTLCNPIDGSPPGSAIPGILQARTLEWVAISFSNAGK